MSADGRVSWVLEITLHQEKACPHFHKGGALCSDGPSALSLSVLDCRGWQKPLLLRETFGHPLPRGHPDTPPPPLALHPPDCQALGAFQLFQPAGCPGGWRPSLGAWRLQAAPPCALWASTAPLQTSLLATAGMPSPPSVYFLSGWGPGSWKPCLHPLPTLSLEDQTQKGWSQRGGCGVGKATSWPPRTPVGKENCCGWVPRQTLPNLSSCPCHPSSLWSVQSKSIQPARVQVQHTSMESL